MNDSVDKLIHMSKPIHNRSRASKNYGFPISDMVETLYSKVDGFYSFESALLVRPLGRKELPYGLLEWNENSLWKSLFNQTLTGHVFFAENIFGEQFSIFKDDIFLFDPELCEFNFFASNLENWAARIISDFDFYTGYSIAHEWQLHNGKLADGNRLIPKIPFVLQGEYSIENLVEKPDLEGMEIRAEIANQISNLSDGAIVNITITD